MSRTGVFAIALVALSIGLYIFFTMGGPTHDQTETIYTSSPSTSDSNEDTTPAKLDSPPPGPVVEEEETLADAPTGDSESGTAPLFAELPIELRGELEEWVNESYLAPHEAPEIVIRTHLAVVDVEKLKDSLMESLAASSHGSSSFNAAVDLNVFPDRNYSVVAYRFRMGSGGFSNIGARVINTTGMGNETFGFEIAPDGRIFGGGNTSTGSYEFEPTPEPGVVLVVEVDTKLIGERAVIK